MAEAPQKEVIRMEGKARKKTGFASMDPARVREIASMGGKAVQAAGKGRQWDSVTGALAAARAAEVYRQRLRTKRQMAGVR